MRIKDYQEDTPKKNDYLVFDGDEGTKKFPYEYLIPDLGQIPILDCNFDDPPAEYIFQTAINPSNPPQLGGSSFIVIQQNPRNNRFTTQLVFGFGDSRIAKRDKFNSETWSDWKYFYPNNPSWQYVSSYALASSMPNYEIAPIDAAIGKSEILVSYGRQNGVQSFGGGTVVLDINEDKPCYLPVYIGSAETAIEAAVIYIHWLPTERKLQFAHYKNTGKYNMLFKVYVR